MRWLAAVVVALLPSCQCNKTALTGDAAFECTPPCTGDLVCRYGVCVAPPQSCTTNADCLGDTYCETGRMECLPWGVGPGGGSDAECKREPVPGVFFPNAQCEWTGPAANDYPLHAEVLATPVVGSFYVHGELSTPSIVFTSYNGRDGGAQSCMSSDPQNYYGVVRIIDGRTCMLQATIASPTLVASASLAIGDLGGIDTTPEIVGVRSDGGLVAWEKRASGWEIMWQSASNFGDDLCNWAGPSLHDLDNDGIVEVLHYGNVYNGQTGATIDESLGATVDATDTGYIPVVADVDGDGVIELVTGSMIYGWNTTLRRWEQKYPLGAASGFVAVADFGTFPANGADDRGTLDGIAEIAVIAGGVATVWTRDNRRVFIANLAGANPGHGGPPTIADFDGDGRVEFAAAGAFAYNVFDPDCTGTPDPQYCNTMTSTGILWTQPSQDGSNKTGSSVFDFDGDGRAEVVYGDECFTRVYDGVSGKVLYSRYRTSCTWYENPVIADVDADFNAEIVTTSNTNCDSVTCPALDPIFDGVQCLDDSDCPRMTTCGREAATDALGRCRCTSDPQCGGDGFACLDPIAGPSAAGKVCRASHPGTREQGIRVLADSIDRWINTRPIWNQHAYSVTNIDDNGRIPTTSQWMRNWTVSGLNNYRQNSPGTGTTAGAIPDLTVRQAKVSCEPGGVVVTAEVCNRGTEPVARGVPVAIYSEGPPRTLQCQTETTQRIDPGFCSSVSCTWASSNGNAVVVADDRGDGSGIASECREDNNEHAISIACP
jgi:hypothetical protein